MRIHIDGRTKGTERVMTITLRGDDTDFINLIDSGDALAGDAGNLVAQIAKASGLVDTRADDRMLAARLLRRASEIMERGTE